ncbi:TRNA pseudouridine synthase [Actinidia chinensis var. chinensis]|uniref:tRNA pseudouridine synthase n=1 Tax=Actinidia chinensis var. chinensis TaxID=1590841 RepID=A0A2R6Q5R0_ACTCC|nr:TRNA pseudouridine synthase [Actinidia chinensis var. chinensis]
MARNEEEDNSQRGHNNAGSATEAVRVRARPDPFLVVCWCFSLITSVAAILCIAVNVIAAVLSFKDGSDVFDGIFRCYAVVIAMFIVIAETEWGFVMKFCKVLEYWVGRGMLQIFVAVMTKAYPEDYENRKVLILLQNIASYMLLACGGVYIISGILCIGLLKRARQKKEVSRDQAVRDLQELEQRREQLEALLLVEERV